MQKHPMAILEIGHFYKNGVGVSPDPKEAVKYFREAAELGLLSAQTKLAWCYSNGYGVLKDEREALAWHRRAADQGDKFSIQVLQRSAMEDNVSAG